MTKNEREQLMHIKQVLDNAWDVNELTYDIGRVLSAHSLIKKLVADKEPKG